ncbi:MAG TPA: FtsX-like permease family protein [Terriglobia bacterium]|nr:FtsX-like permease family protein [Terriglobia bacterium]
MDKGRSNGSLGWQGKMAWRDSRTNRKQLLVFVSSIVLGVAALVGISSFGRNLRAIINEQAKTLLGADLVIRSPRPWNPEAEEFLRTIPGRESREVSFLSMVTFPGHPQTRLAQVRSLEGDFPFYGEFETEPKSAAASFRSSPSALVEETLMLQLGLRVGDIIRIGSFDYRIAGKLRKVPGEGGTASMLGGRVYIPMRYLSQTRLLQAGSLANYRAYFQLRPGVDAEALGRQLEPSMARLQLDSETVEERKASLGRAFQNMYHYLNLVGFVALLLGGIGIASSIHVYVTRKLNTIAVLRCLGAGIGQTFRIYLAQALAVGLAGAMAGSLLGLAIQWLLPTLLREFLPITIPFSISWLPVLEGLAIGVALALLFSLLPLLQIRRISPLLALRSSFEGQDAGHRDPYRYLIYLLLMLATTAFAIAQTREWRQGLAFTAGIVISLGLLALVGRLMMALVSRFLPDNWPYVWRQGLANLYRPNNQTLVLLLSLGLGCCLITTVYLIHHLLLSQISLSGGSNRPNLILFDIQSDQRPAVAQLLQAQGAPALQQVPIVTMRLTQVKGQKVESLLLDKRRTIPEWLLRREYRCTYRDRLEDTETIVAGRWNGHAETATIPAVSLEDKTAQRLKVQVGDHLDFDVQGVPMAVTVGSLRKVEWGKATPNFFIVFPEGVLEKAPKFYVMMTRSQSSQMSAQIQQAVVSQFPNVSVIDLALILASVDAVLAKVSFVIRFMAMFSIFTGLTVLGGAVITGRYQRIQESVLLKTLGASRRQVLRILMVEYVFLGLFSSLSGSILAVAATWALARFLFKVTLTIAYLPTVAVLLGVLGLTLLTGMLSSRGIHSRPPLEVLRSDT